MIYDSQKCLKWIKDNYDIDYHDRFGIVDLVFEYVKLHEKERFDELEAERKRKEEQEEVEKTRDDYHEIVDENNRTWFEEVHLSEQRPESRKLMQGDAIIFKGSLPGYEGDKEGFMIINSFDFDSDFAARSYYAIENCCKVEKETECKTNWVSYYGGGAPGFHLFSYATDDEIAQFFSKLKEAKYSDYLFYFKSSITPDYIKQRYHRYLDGYETWETYKKR